MMPHLANPWALLLLLLVPPLVWWRWRQAHTALRHPGAAWLDNLPPGRGLLAQRGGILLRALALLLLIIALAGPRWPDGRTRLPTEGIAIVMLVDVSGSMAEPDFNWDGEPVSRLDAVKRVFRLFVDGGEGPGGVQLQGRDADLIGLVVFATRPESPCPLTLSHSVLLSMLDVERPRHVPDEAQTNLSDAIVLGLHRLRSAGPRRKVLVLLSDGEHNVPAPRSQWTPRQAAQIAASLDVPIYAIDASGATSSGREGNGTGSGDGGRALQDVAAITRGRYFTARDTDALLGVCREIDELERQEIRSFQYRRYYEGYPWLALGAFLAWTSALVLEMTVWRRVP
jgi:Ca-activated chloride channel family protein